MKKINTLSMSRDLGISENYIKKAIGTYKIKARTLTELIEEFKNSPGGSQTKEESFKLLIPLVTELKDISLLCQCIESNIYNQKFREMASEKICGILKYHIETAGNKKQLFTIKEKIPSFYNFKELNRLIENKLQVFLSEELQNITTLKNIKTFFRYCCRCGYKELGNLTFKKWSGMVSTIEEVVELYQVGHEEYGNYYAKDANKLEKIILKHINNISTIEELLNLKKILGPIKDKNNQELDDVLNEKNDFIRYGKIHKIKSRKKIKIVMPKLLSIKSVFIAQLRIIELSNTFEEALEFCGMIFGFYNHKAVRFGLKKSTSLATTILEIKKVYQKAHDNQKTEYTLYHESHEDDHDLTIIADIINSILLKWITMTHKPEDAAEPYKKIDECSKYKSMALKIIAEKFY